MAAVVLLIGLLNINILLRLFLQIIIGAAIYITGSKLAHIDSYEYIKNTIKNYLNKRKK